MSLKTVDYLQELNVQKNILTAHLNKTNISVDEAEKFNLLIDKVGEIVETPRIEIEYSGENIVKARLFYLKSIPNYLFYKQPLTNVALYHSDIKSIDAYAFAETRLSSFTIPDTVESIGNYAFYQCPISSLQIPKSVISIGSNAYYGASIRELNIPSNVTSIGSRAFYECGSLKKITLPDTPVTLGSDIFGRTAITSFDFPEWLTDIPSQMFYCCYSLRLTSLPNTIVSIGSGAFQATACSFTVLPNSVTTVGSRAFVGLPITSLTIPNSVTSLGTGLFSGSASVTNLYLNCNCMIPSNVITDSINKNSRLKYVEIGAIGMKQTAFNYCTGLLKVWIRETCTTIEATTNSYPFSGCKSVVLYVEADSKPEGWAEEFNKLSSTTYANVIYGVKTSPF